METESEDHCSIEGPPPHNSGLPARFELLNPIGQGGMGTVWRAYDRHLGKEVAVKFLHASLKDREKTRSRFLREGKTLASLSHPNIIKLLMFDVTENGCPYQVTDLLEGETLAEFLKREKVLPATLFREVFPPILSALRYAWTCGVVHRDVKPGNIYLSMSPGDSLPVPFLMDFGIAITDNENASLTATESLIGSPLYMSPEQCRGSTVDYRADVYSLGCVMYECLSGRTPYATGASVMETMYMHLSCTTVPKLNIQVPQRQPTSSLLVDLIYSCLRKDPNLRPQSPDQLSLLLQQALEELPDGAIFSASPFPSLKIFNWSAATVGVFVLLIIAIPIGFHTDKKVPEFAVTSTVPGNQSAEDDYRKHKLIVDRLQKRFDNPCEKREGVASLLFDALWQLRDASWSLHRYDETIASNQRMLNLCQYLENGKVNRVEALLHQCSIRLEYCMAKAESNSLAPDECEKIQQAALRDLEEAKFLAAKFRPSPPILKVKSTECIFYASLGQLGRARDVLHSMTAVFNQITDLAPPQMHRISNNLYPGWSEEFYKNLGQSLVASARCKTVSDWMVLCQMHLFIAEILDRNHDFHDHAEASRRDALNALQAIKPLPEVGTTGFAQYRDLLQKCRK